MSMIFRTIASVSRTLFQALVPAALLILDLVIFTGFVIPKSYMLGWCSCHRASCSAASVALVVSAPLVTVSLRISYVMYAAAEEGQKAMITTER